MRKISLFALSCIVTIACLSASAAERAKTILAEPSVIAPNQNVTLRWYFTGDKVVISGGRFGKGVVVTGRSNVTDHPLKTTRYTFAIDYKGDAPGPDGTRVIKTLHQQYSVVVEVSTAPMQTYKSPRGWSIHYLKGWHADVVNSPEVVFLQPEEDSVERVAVARYAIKDETCKEVMQQVKSDVTGSYADAAYLNEDEFLYHSDPALYSCFTGKCRALEMKPTQSVVLTLVRDGYAYVVSARASTANFKARRLALEQMVQSFLPPPKSGIVKPAAPATTTATGNATPATAASQK